MLQTRFQIEIFQRKIVKKVIARYYHSKKQIYQRDLNLRIQINKVDQFHLQQRRIKNQNLKANYKVQKVRKNQQNAIIQLIRIQIHQNDIKIFIRIQIKIRKKKPKRNQSTQIDHNHYHKLIIITMKEINKIQQQVYHNQQNHNLNDLMFNILFNNLMKMSLVIFINLNYIFQILFSKIESLEINSMIDFMSQWLKSFLIKNKFLNLFSFKLYHRLIIDNFRKFQKLCFLEKIVSLTYQHMYTPKLILIYVYWICLRLYSRKDSLILPDYHLNFSLFSIFISLLKYQILQICYKKFFKKIKNINYKNTKKMLPDPWQLKHQIQEKEKELYNMKLMQNQQKSTQYQHSAMSKQQQNINGSFNDKHQMLEDQQDHSDEYTIQKSHKQEELVPTLESGYKKSTDVQFYELPKNSKQRKKYGNMIIFCEGKRFLLSLGPNYLFFFFSYLCFTFATIYLVGLVNTSLENVYFKIFNFLFCWGQNLSYILVALSNPGIKLPQKQITMTEEQIKQNRFCKKCGAIQQRKTYHCRQCDICVLDYDHHCPWTSKCIGGGNLKRFYFFVCMTPFYIFYYMVVFMICMANMAVAQSKNLRTSPPTF